MNKALRWGERGGGGGGRSLNVTKVLRKWRELIE